MPSPEDYQRLAGFRRSTAPDAAGPTAAGSPTVDDAPPTMDRMVSTDGQSTFIPEAWLKAIKANEDTILAREGGQGLDLYEALLDDDVAFSAIQQRFLAVTSRDWEVTPGDDKDPRSVKAADDFRAMLNGIGFDRVTKGLLWSVWFGYGVGEAMWTMKVHDGRPIVWLEDVVIPDRRWFGFTIEGELRLTSTIAGMTGEELPANKFLAVRTGGTHDFAFYGLGLAHWLYWPIFFKRSALKFWALYLEKFGMPTVAIEFPPEEKDDKKALADRLAAAVAVGQDRAVLVPKGALSDNQLQLIEAERSGAGASSYKDFVTIQDDAAIRVILGQTGTSKAQKGGLGGDGQAKKDEGVKREIIKSDSDLISETIHRTIATWVTGWNYGPDVAPPNVFRVLDDEEDLNTVADRDVKLNGIGIKRTEESVAQVYGEGYTVDRLSEEDKAANAAALANAKVLPGAPAANDNAAAKRAKIAEFAAQGSDKPFSPLYVYRPVKPKTAAKIVAFAKSIGITTPLAASDMHVTELYSKTAVDWFEMAGEGWDSEELRVQPGGPRFVERFGDAIVLRFDSPVLRYRNAAMREKGASSDHETYNPHVTLGYGYADIDLATVEPFLDELLFGPEIFEPIKTDAAFDAATFDFAAADEEAIDRLVRSLVDETNPIFSAMVEDMKSALQGVTTAEGARVALVEASERFPIERLARLTALPMLAERAGALVNAEDLVEG